MPNDIIITVPNTPALSQDDDLTDYTLNPEHRTVWITVDNVSISIRRQKKDVWVAMYAQGCETQTPINSSRVAIGQAQSIIDASENEPYEILT